MEARRCRFVGLPEPGGRTPELGAWDFLRSVMESGGVEISANRLFASEAGPRRMPRFNTLTTIIRSNFLLSFLYNLNRKYSTSSRRSLSRNSRRNESRTPTNADIKSQRLDEIRNNLTPREMRSIEKRDAPGVPIEEIAGLRSGNFYGNLT